MAEDPRPERAAGEAGRPGGIVRVTAACGLDWTGRRRAWDVWFSGRHAWAHNKGRDGLPATCGGVTITPAQAEPARGPQTTADDPRAAGLPAGTAPLPGRQRRTRAFTMPGARRPEAAARPQPEPEAGA